MKDWKNKRIAVLYGGPSSEREISLETGQAVFEALRELGYDAFLIDVGPDVADRLRAERADVVFNGLHGRVGEDGCIQGLLEVMRIPYTGSGVLASAMAINKDVSKRIFQARDIPTPMSLFFPGATAAGLRSEDLPFGLPAVVKPVAEGSSVGVTIIREEGALASALEQAASFGGGVLLEAYVSGMEVHVAILEDEPLGAIQVIPPAEFYDFQAKYRSGETKYIFPAPLEPKLEARVLEVAHGAYQALGCSGYGRVDLIVSTETEQCWVLEVNTLPGMTATSLVPKIAAGRGIGFAELCERILHKASLEN